ncbi:MAG: branched-chain amino acid transporter permease [Marmoricola sp.]|nr:branched-chain amino acid transporter permease [Marmoricola sp.]
MRNSGLFNDHVKRLLGCLAGGVVLALMVGNQEGVQRDFGYAFRAAIFSPRLVVFLGFGLALFVAITYWSRISPYFVRPGARPLAAGAAAVVASYGLLHWTDSNQVTGGKLGALSSAVSGTDGISSFTRTFFGSVVPGTPWLLLVVVVALGVVSLVLRLPVLAWLAAGLGLLVGVWGYIAQSAVSDYLKTADHSTGAQVAILGYAAIASGCFVIARSQTDQADTVGFIERVFGWRPGFPLAVLGTAVGLVALLTATWFSPADRNPHLSGMTNLFSGEGLSAISSAYLSWLVWVIFVVALALAFAATYLSRQAFSWASIVIGLGAVVLTLTTMHEFSSIGGKSGFDGANGPWQNIGAGPWMLCGAFTMFAGAGWIALRQGRRVDPAAPTVVAKAGSNLNQVLIIVVLAGALFYPPTATQFWQTVIVAEIGIYVLLAIGLNVVVGWAGLLDLGFIAFYAIGSYTTAYLTGTLPIKPPDWLHLTPLAAIPFAIVICLLAGLALGAPTLRLRGDYLAIVTLGFGEIIRIVAVNADKVTNGPKGAFGIPQPVIHLGPIHIQWGQSALQFWYLLLVLIGVTVLLFNRLEHSRLGRAWAAIREDEVAAQATGINTTRVKLLAFAIGASTSGVAGVFFASQIGYINPDNFLLNNSILVVAYVVFGGMGSLPGAIAGAATLTWLPEFLKDQVPAEDRQMWIGAVILLMMIFRPAGLIPAKRRAAELSGFDGVKSAETVAVPAGEGM